MAVRDGLTYDQIYFIVTLSCYLVAAGLLWRSWVLKPFKLWTTFQHEFSHALGAWVCCHTVTGIEVHADEGGLTHWKGRNVECAKHLVVPAGYLGSCMWGCLIMLSCMDPAFTRIMALILTAALGVCLGYAMCGQTKDPSDRSTLIALSVGFMTILGGVTVACFFELFTGCQQLLEAMLLWVGALNMLYATVDIYDDTVRRTDERSDAYVYSQMVPGKLLCCGSPQCVGCTWLLLAVGAFVGTIWGTLLWAGELPGDPSWTAFLPGPLVLTVAVLCQLLLPCLCAGGKSEGRPLLG